MRKLIILNYIFFWRQNSLLLVLEAQNSGQHSNQNCKNHARNGEGERELIDIIAHWNILPRNAHPPILVTVLLRRLLLSLLAAVVEDFRGRLHAHHPEGTPVQLEAHILEDLLDGGAFVVAGWQLV